MCKTYKVLILWRTSLLFYYIYWKYEIKNNLVVRAKRM